MDREITLHHVDFGKLTVILSDNGNYQVKDRSGLRDANEEEKSIVEPILQEIKNSIINQPKDPYNYKQGE